MSSTIAPALKTLLHLLIYETAEGEQRFHVHAVGLDGKDVDVTDQYELAACREEKTGRAGFTMFRKAQAEETV